MESGDRFIIVLLLDEERLNSRHFSNNKQIEKHLQEAKKLLEEIPEKDCNMLALLASLQYKKAGYEAFLNLVEAQDLFDQPKTSLKLAAGDAIRQIAWVLPLEVIQHKAELFVKSLALEDNSFQLVSKLNLHVFYCQKALWNLIEQVKKHANGNFEHDATKIERIPLEEINQETLIQKARLQFQVLELMNNQSEVDRLKSAPDNVKQLHELHIQTLQHFRALEELWDNDRIVLASYFELKRSLKSDLALIEALKKINLSLLRGNAILIIKSHLGTLKSLVNFDGVPSFFFLLLKSLRTTLELIEDELPILYYLPQTPAESSAYNSLILKIGNQLDAICVFFNFKHLLMDRLQDFNVTLEPELDKVYETK